MRTPTCTLHTVSTRQRSAGHLTAALGSARRVRRYGTTSCSLRSSSPDDCPTSVSSFRAVRCGCEDVGVGQRGVRVSGKDDQRVVGRVHVWSFDRRIKVN